MTKTIGNIRTLEGSDRPDIGAYLMSVDLTDDERKEVTEQFAAVETSIRRPVDSPVPLIVNGFWK